MLVPGAVRFTAVRGFLQRIQNFSAIKAKKRHSLTVRW